VQVLYYLALRVSELCSLRIADLDFEGGSAFISQGKGAKDRLVPLGKAAGAIKRYLDTARPAISGADSKYLFAGRTKDGCLTRAHVRQIVKKAGGGYPHRLRHTAATHLVERGCPLNSVAAILGHSDLSTTERYLHLDISFVRSQLLAFHPLAAVQPQQEVALQ
jgi:site-specific recombinase XerD